MTVSVNVFLLGKMNIIDDDKGNKVAAADSGAVAKDATKVVGEDGNFAKTIDGKNVVVDGNGHKVAADDAGNIFKDPKGNAYAIDKDSNYLQPELGKFGVYDQATGKLVAADAQG